MVSYVARIRTGEAGQIERSAGLADSVYQRIRADIMSLKIPPDTKVSVDNLARQLGVSQTPIREALSMLEANGLVTKKQFSGYCTLPRMGRSQLDDLFEFRLLLEPHLAKKAAESMTHAEAKKLRKAIGEDAPSHDAFADFDTEFHKIIGEGAGNHLIADSLARLHIHIHIFRSCFRTEIAKEAVVEHREVSDAISKKDGRLAQATMKKHIERSYERLRTFIKD